ncbi:MAG: hypothetical protein IT376_06380 [Polyangiaceae bacterium]|nr:hypothetical protein [Polyangiaceae bacterium]
MLARFRQDGPARRVALALGVYAVATAVYFACAARPTLTQHTQWNHFSLLASSWLSGRLDLGGPPPAYAGNNDFALYDGKHFVVFPPFPAVLLLPVVKLAGSPTAVQDGQFFLWLAGVGPAALFLALEKLRIRGHSTRSTPTNLALAGAFAFGTVYFFTAEQGTVWYAAHVVGVALAALHVLFALDAERPWLAGLTLGLGALTRAPLVFLAPLFLFEVVRTSVWPGAGPWPARVAWRRLLARSAAFAAPIVLLLAAAAWHNQARFGSPLEDGYRYLTVAWQGRMQRWGLFHYRYLGRNLAVVLTGLPFWNGRDASPPLQVNAHGLALWVTTPAYLWLLWPRVKRGPYPGLVAAALAVALPTLLYQNTGWTQFGYRFSNDYAPLLFALLAVGGRPFRAGFWALAGLAVLVNAWGANTFNRAPYARWYFQDNTQRVLHQPD